MNKNTVQSGGMGNLKEKQVAKFNMMIRPAVPVELRHKIADLLEQEGYNVWAQGQFTDGNACDILFDLDKKPV